MTQDNGLGLCKIRWNLYKSDEWEMIVSDLGEWK